ncbi:MAG: hypothetical protein EOP87_20055, partial [Verrucomicrobiaceae bacterium]
MKTTSRNLSMDPLAFWRKTALLAIASMTPLAAQSLREDLLTTDVRPLAADDLRGRDVRRFAEITVPGTYEVPAMKAAPHFKEGAGIFATQNHGTLGVTGMVPADVADAVDLSTLREPSPFRRAAMSAGISGTEASASNLPLGLALLAATYSVPADAPGKIPCSELGLSVGQRVKLDPSKILEIVELAITAQN